MLRYAVPLAFFFLVTAWFVWPLPAECWNSMAGYPGDPLLTMWIQCWDYHAVSQLEWKHFFDANIFYPAPLTLALSDHMLSNLLTFGPAYALTANPVFAQNIVFMLSFVLSAFAMYLLAYYWTRSIWASLVAGMIFGFFPARIAHLGHVQLLCLYWTPLALLFLDRYLRCRRLSDQFTFSLFFTLQAWAGLYNGYFVGLLCLVYYAVFRLWYRCLPKTKDLLIPVVLAVTLLPVSYPYLELKQYFHFRRELSEVLLYSADLGRSFLSITRLNWLYGELLRPFEAEYAGIEKMLFFGLVPVILMVIGLVRVWRNSGEPDETPQEKMTGSRWRFGFLDRIRGWIQEKRCETLPAAESSRHFAGSVFALMFLFSVVLSLGPVLFWFGRGLFHPLPYRLLFDFAPGFASMRVPARAMLPAMMAPALLSAFALAGYRREKCCSAVVLVLISLEYSSSTLPSTRIPVGNEVPPAYQWLSKQSPSDGAVVEIPIEEGIEESWRIYYSCYHFLPIANGSSGFTPETYFQLRAELHRAVDENTVRYLSVFGVRTILLHRDKTDPAPWDRLVASGSVRRERSFGDVEILRLPAVESPGRIEMTPPKLDRVSADSSFDLSVGLRPLGGTWKNPRPVKASDVEIVWEGIPGTFRGMSAVVMPRALVEPTSIKIRTRSPSLPGRYRVSISEGQLRVSRMVTVEDRAADTTGLELSRIGSNLHFDTRDDLGHRAIDGRQATRWSSFEPQLPGRCVEVDLLGEVRSDGMRMDLAGDLEDYPRDLGIWVSRNHFDWSPAVDLRSELELTKGPSGQRGGYSLWRWRPVEHRYLRACLESYHPQFWWSIAELGILGAYAGEEPGTSLNTPDLKFTLAWSDAVVRDDIIRVEVQVRNLGEATWLRMGPSGRGSVRLGLQWGEPAGDEAELLQLVDLPGIVEPGQSAAVTAELKRPAKPGTYHLRAAILRDGNHWTEPSIIREFRFEAPSLKEASGASYPSN